MKNNIYTNRQLANHIALTPIPLGGKAARSAKGGLKSAFTLAEVVITLIVIGIVAAITVPMLQHLTSDKKWIVANQKARASIAEAFKLMTVNGEIDTKWSTQQFVENVIPNYLKLTNTCALTDAKKCGFSTAANFYTRPDGNKVTMPIAWRESTKGSVRVRDFAGYELNSTPYNHPNPNTNNSYMFKTMDGFSVNFFYNPYCASDTKDKPRGNGFKLEDMYDQAIMDTVCFMGIYDLNGTKGPNKVGKDIGFIGSFYNGFAVRAVTALPNLPKLKSGQVSDYIKYCNEIGENNDWILPDHDQAVLLALNIKLLYGTNGNMDNTKKDSFVSRTTYKTTTGDIRYYGTASTNHDWDYTRTANITSNSSLNLFVTCVANNALK